MLLPCGPANHATLRNRTHRAAADLEAAAPPELEPAPDRPTEMLMAIDGAHSRAAHGYQLRHIDVTVGRIEVAGRKPRRFALAPKGVSAPLATLRKALREQGWRPGTTVTVVIDGESALPGMVRAAVDEPVTCFWIGGTSRCGFSISSKRCAAFVRPSHNIGQGWKSSSGELSGYSISSGTAITKRPVVSCVECVIRLPRSSI